jgi:hypothetical protein
MTRSRPTGYGEARLDSGSHRGTRFRIKSGMTVLRDSGAIAGMTVLLKIPGRCGLVAWLG